MLRVSGRGSTYRPGYDRLVPAVVLTVFGETRTVFAWSKRPECAVSLNTLRARLATGVWDIEAAITTPGATGQHQRGVPLSGEQADELRATAEKVRLGPKVHRYTPADAPEAVALRDRNTLILAAIVREHSMSEIGRAVGLSDEQVRTIRDGARTTCAHAPQAPHCR